MKWLRWLHEDERGILQFLLPLLPGLLLSAIQGRRRGAAEREIEQAEEAEIPREEAAIREELAQRGFGPGQTSAFASQVGRPRAQFQLSRRVARARNVLSQPTIDPFMLLTQYLAGKIGQPRPTDGGRGGSGVGSLF